MCKKLLCLLSLALMLGWAGAVTAQDWDIEIPSTNVPPVIDGEVDGVWSIASVQYITVTIDGSVDSPADSSGSWRVMWDTDNLYAIVDVNDESLYNDSSNSYLDDSVEFYFDGGNTKGPGAPLSDDDRQYTFGWTTDDVQGTNTDTAGVEHAQVRTDTGWRIEIKLPWLSLQGTAPQLDDLIGIDCFYNDDDNGEDSRESQIATFADDSGDWQVPSDWGTGILVKGSREKASGPDPEDGEIDVLRDVVLAWTLGEFAQTHDVYFGTVFEDVNTASRIEPKGALVSEGQSDTTYDPDGLLEYGQTYYWRIDEVNGAPDDTIFRGEVWSLTIEPLASPISGIAATSNTASEEGMGPDKTIDGSGLNDNDGHSIDAPDMWLGTPPEGEAPWIQYDFGVAYKLYQMLVWNYNIQFELILGFGFKDVTVEYSADGVDWIALDAVEFAKGTSGADYMANTTIDFGGVAARYVRLTADNSWGGMGDYGLSEVRFLAIPVQARYPEPADGATEIDVDAALTWRAGREAASHEVYLSDDAQAVADGTALVGSAATSSYTVGSLDFGTTYYWKVDEVNEAEGIGLWEGRTWSFTTQEYGVVDDFEAYDNEENRIYDTWVDGWVNGSASIVGYASEPFAETGIVNGGKQSMPLEYDNSISPFYSEASRTFAAAQDWTAGGANSLRLSFYGATDNTAETLYVAVEDSSGQVASVSYSDPDAVLTAAWQEWTISLDAFSGVNLASVGTIHVGLGDRDNPSAGGGGLIYVDDIGVGRPIGAPNLLANGGFEDGVMEPWSLYGDVTAEVVTDDAIEGGSCLHVTVGSAGANFWDSGLQHTGHVFEAGKQYTLSAFLKCSSGTLDINFKPELAADPWSGFGDQVFTMTEQWAEFSVTTGVLEEDVDPAAITFHIGFAATDFWIDGVRFYEGSYVPAD